MPTQTLVLLVTGAFALIAIAMLGSAFFTVEQRTTAIVQRLGKFPREAGPGIHVKVPALDKEIGASSRTNAILIPHSPGNLTTLTEQMRNAMMEADQTVRVSDPAPLPDLRAAASETSVPGNGG